MNKRSGGLGRGLGALIPSGGAMSTAAGSSLTELAVAAVIPNRFQPREHFDEEALASLTASIREMGVLQPILVRPAVDDQYEIIAGERRWRAAKRAGLQHIPAIVRDDRRHGRARARAGREPASPRSQSARRGGGLPTAHGRLRPDPGARCAARRSQPLGGRQHAAPVPTATVVTTNDRGRPAHRRPCPGTAGNARIASCKRSWPTRS